MSIVIVTPEPMMQYHFLLAPECFALPLYRKPTHLSGCLSAITPTYRVPTMSVMSAVFTILAALV